MGRMFGWVGPIAYLVAVLIAAVSAACGAAGAWTGGLCWDMGAAPTADVPGAVVASWTAPAAAAGPAAAASGWASLPLLVLCGAWLFALVWFGCQAIILHPDKLEDERWTAHMMNVALVSRLVLLPLNVALALGSLALAAHGLAGQAGPSALAAALFVALTGVLLALPAAVYHLCSATRLANRGMLGVSGLVGHAVLSFFPLLGFVATASLYVNGRASLLAEHDRRVAEEALGRAQGAEGPGASGPEGPQGPEASGPEGLPGAGESGDVPEEPQSTDESGQPRSGQARQQSASGAAETGAGGDAAAGDGSADGTAGQPGGQEAGADGADGQAAGASDAERVRAFIDALMKTGGNGQAGGSARTQ